MLVTWLVFHVLMGPYVAPAAVSSLQYKPTAVCSSAVSLMAYGLPGPYVVG